MLFLQKLWTALKVDLIISGTIGILFMIVSQILVIVCCMLKTGLEAIMPEPGSLPVRLLWQQARSAGVWCRQQRILSVFVTSEWTAICSVSDHSVGLAGLQQQAWSEICYLSFVRSYYNNSKCRVREIVKYKHNSVWRAAVMARSLIRLLSFTLSRNDSGQVVLSHTHCSINKHIGQRATVIFCECGWDGNSRLDG